MGRRLIPHIAIRPLVTRLIALLLLWRCSPSLSAGDFTPSSEELRQIQGMTISQLYDAAKQYEKSGKRDSAIFYYNLVFSRFKDGKVASDAELCAQSLLSQGTLSYDGFNYAEAMNFYLKCVDFCQQYHLDAILANAYRCMGNIYSQFNDYTQSKELYRKSLEATRQSHEGEAIEKALYNLIIAHAITKELIVAESYYAQLKELDTGTPKHAFDLAFTKAVINEQRGHTQEALAGYSAAMATGQEHQLGENLIGSCRSRMAIIYAGEKDYAKAIQLLQQNEQEATAHDVRDLLTSTYREMAEVYDMMGEKDLNVAYMMKHIELYNEIFNLARFNSLKNAQVIHDMNLNAQEITRLQDEKTRQRNIIIVCIAAALLLSLFSLMLYRQKRQLSSAYKDLFEHNNATVQSERRYLHLLNDAQHQTEKLREKLRLQQSMLQMKDLSSADDAFADDADTGDNSAILARLRYFMEHDDAYLYSDFNIDKMAQIVGTNTKTLSMLIKEEYGCNFRSFLNEYRIKEAMVRINDLDNFGNLTIKAISESVGYKSQSNFITVFTKITGVKPSIYLRMAQEKAEKSSRS